MVKAHAAEETGGQLLLALEYVEGEDLERVVAARGPLPVGEACGYARQTALGLQHAFEKGMVHRDIKPKNLMRAVEEGKPVVKILDFGLAKAVLAPGTESRGLTGTGATLGTPHYMAPEQSEDASRVDIRADIYSLGCTLYFLLTGRPPFHADNLLELLQAHVSAEAAPLNEVRPEVPAGLAAVAAKMMAKDPARRFQTPAEAALALASFTGDEAKPASPPAAGGKVEAIMEAPKGASAASAAAGIKATDNPFRSMTPVWRSPVKGRVYWVIGSGVLAAALLVGAVWLWTAGRPKPATPDGALVVEVDEPGAEVYVDGVRFGGAWADDGKTATVPARPGRRKVEVKKEEFTPYTEEAALEDGKPALVVHAHLQTEWTVGAKGARFASLGEAVQAAPADALIEVLPGVYQEKPLVLTKNVRIVGRGPRTGVTIRCEEGTAVQARAVKVVLRGLTITAKRGSAVEVSQGACRLEDCDLSHADAALPCQPLLLAHEDGTAVDLVGCGIHNAFKTAGVVAVLCRLTAENCTIKDTGAHGIFAAHADVKLRSCEVSGTGCNNVWACRHTTLDASDCQFDGGPKYFASLSLSGEEKGGETTATLTRCQFTGGKDYGVAVCQGATATLNDCDLTGNKTGVWVKSQQDKCWNLGLRTLTKATITSCRVTNNREFGLWTEEDAEAVVADCHFQDNGLGSSKEIKPSHIINGGNNQGLPLPDKTP